MHCTSVPAAAITIVNGVPATISARKSTTLAGAIVETPLASGRRSLTADSTSAAHSSPMASSGCGSSRGKFAMSRAAPPAMTAVTYAAVTTPRDANGVNDSRPADGAQGEETIVLLVILVL